MIFGLDFGSLYIWYVNLHQCWFLKNIFGMLANGNHLLFFLPKSPLTRPSPSPGPHLDGGN